MAQQFANNAASKLAAPIASGDTSCAVTPGDGAKFPALGVGDFFMATLVKSTGELEIVKVTARATDAFTITRAQEGTAAIAFSAGDRIEARFTKGSIDDMVAKTATAQAAADAAQATADDAQATADSIVANGSKRALVENLRGSYTTAPEFRFSGAVFRPSSGTGQCMYVSSTTADIVVTIDPSVVGVNGRDVATDFVDGQNVSFYAIWGSGKPIVGVASAGTSWNGGPTAMPAGYTHWCYLSLLKKNAGQYADFRQAGNRIWFKMQQTVWGSSSSASPIAASASGWVPVAGNEVRSYHGSITTSLSTVGAAGGGAAETKLGYIADTNYSFASCLVDMQVVGAYLTTNTTYEAPGNAMFYAWVRSSGSPATWSGIVYVSGYTIFNGSD